MSWIDSRNWKIWKWRPVEIVQCRESIQEIITYPHIKFWWYRTMLNFCGIVVAMIRMSLIDSRHWTISTGRHFQNGHHNIAKIQHCPTSHLSIFNVGNQFRTSFSTHISNFDDIGQCWILAILWWPFWKWWPVEIVQCSESIRDIRPPQYRKNSTLSDIITIWYVGR
jgi:hypothetical protein